MICRTKLKQTEVDCEFLKRCCENLTEENRRLQKEVQELRALKLSPQFYLQMNPPTTLTMCPSCERVAVPPSSASSTVDRPHPLPHPHMGATYHHRPIPMNPWAPAAVPFLWAASSVVIKNHKQGHFGECKKFVCILMILYIGMSNV